MRGEYYRIQTKVKGDRHQPLKGVSHEIFVFSFFSWISFSRAPENPKKIRGDIHNFVFMTGVVDTGNKLFVGVNDTGDRLIWLLILFIMQNPEPLDFYMRISNYQPTNRFVVVYAVVGL